ncbi:MAG: hypothetical protein H6Q73_4030 [Firmicutes bacterium]|nr:hypothetical protein [Bacillota bacterium]
MSFSVFSFFSAKISGEFFFYAVANGGFYANNHLRLDRKLKTSLDNFWQETGGKLSGDQRFYELPLEEPRKTLAEVESHKRNQYRKRFAVLDAITMKITNNLQSVLKKA